ncbi:sel1 repeat family protein [Lysobacter sp. cf310]|uniref:sel1 repeat family protein n=1 Tax=Lysobacter sp. cf310 TaxID=1761790 RepID=UPI0008E6EEB3|nr:sel1 repeat family protein [Lysobacter sp. cf310]SFK67885.1 hypothetical protein SAMN04487938_1573 [Lysobacter sp. cf310]
MQSNQRRSRIAIVLIALLTVGLAAGGWWSRRAPESHAAAAERPAEAVESPNMTAAQAPATGGPAAELLRARRPNTVPRVSTFTRSYDPPPGRAVDVVAALQPRAEAGDNDAAFYLFVKVEGCRYALYHGGSGSGTRAAPVAGDDLEAQLIARTPPQCHGLTLDQYRNNVRWLEQAADSGIAMAQLSYARNAEAVIGNSSQMLSDPEKVIAYRRKAMHYMQQAAAGGSIEGLMSLGDAYHYGVITRRDPIRAYAYYYAKDLAAPSAYGQKRLQAYADLLNSTQLATATQQGRDIYDACCKP